MVEVLIKLYGKNINPNITYKFRKGDVRHCFADIAKIRKKLGFEPEIDIEKGMKELVEWSKNAEAIDNFEEANEKLKKYGIV